MNFHFLKEHRLASQIFGASLLLIGLIVVISLLSNLFTGELDPRTAPGTRTAIALTSDALLGPFPTSTAPTATVSNTPTTTPSATRTPTRTRTPTPTLRLLITFTASTNDPRGTPTSTLRPTRTRTPRPTRTSIPPRTNTPRPTLPPRTNTPRPTATPRPTIYP